MIIRSFFFIYPGIGEKSEAHFSPVLVNLPDTFRITSGPPAMSLPTLDLALELDPADVFGSLEWVLANARRTGLTLQALRFDANAAQGVRFSASAPVPELLHVFVRRIGHGVEVRIVDAEFGDDIDSLDGLASVTLPEPVALHA
ncbi:hypothetical protein D3C86_1835400 [compost metagenome]